MTSIEASLLVALAGLVALIVCFRKGPEYAFLGVYLPLLLLLPDQCRMSFSGQFNFSESAIIPIGAYYLCKEGRHWKWSFTDFLVLAFASLVSLSEYMNTQYWLAQHVALGMTTTVILPYVIAKGLVMRQPMSAGIARKIVILAAFVAIVSVYEFRMAANPFVNFVSPLFPEIAKDVAFRYGVARVRGPWTHPILAGIILAVAFRIARWLEWTGDWPGNVPFLPISKVRFCELALLGGSVLTISRGPWVGAAVAAVIVMLVRAPHRTYVTALAVCATFIVAIPVYSAFDAYTSASVSADEAQSSATYRKEMNEKYWTIANERPTWGWGENDVGHGLYPTIEGMSSIDNHYLLLALNSGMYALASMILILLWMPARLLVFSLRHSRDDPTSSAAVTLMGVFIIFVISISTVYLGAQTQPLFFLITGWGEGVLMAPAAIVLTARVPFLARAARVQFDRVMA